MNKEDLKKIKYVNINRHSTYSTLKGLDNVKQILKESVDKGFEGASILDLYNMAAALPFYQFSRDSALLSKLGVDKNIPIILGCQLNIVPSLMDRDNRENRISIIAKNEIGFSNLCKLTSISYLPDHFYKIPKITLQELLDNKEGLIVTTGGMNGIIPQDIYMRTANAKSNFELFKKEFGEDFYVELHIHNLTKDLEWSYRKKQHDDLGFDPQEIVNKRLVELAKQYNVKCYFAQNSFMKNKSSHLLQKIQIGNSLDGKTGWHYQNPMYTMSVEEMYEYIQENSPYLLDIIDFKEACENSVEILNKSKDIELKFEPALPDIKYNECNVNIGDLHKKIEKELESLRSIGDKPLNFLIDKSEKDISLRTTLKVILRNNKIDMYNKEERERLVFELFTIQRNGIIDLCDYFLLLEDVTNFLNKNKWLRGFGRGSGAGSILAYATDITDCHPLKFTLLFERFLTKARVGQQNFQINDYDIQEAYKNFNLYRDFDPEQKAFKKIKELVDKKECPKYLEEYKEKELYYLDCNQEIAEYIVSHLDKKMDKNVNNSTILFLLGITDEEPTKSITATPTGLPDIDYDAETSEFVNARDEIKTYCRDKYGNDHVALLGTYMTLQLKGTVKDVCRQLHPEIPFLEINKLTKKFDVLSPLDFKSPLKYFLAIMEEDSDVEKWFNDRPQTKRAVAELLGNVKSTGIHAGGVVVTKKDIKSHIPLHFERAQGFWVTQPEMAYVEWAGFIKYDFLGLKTLSYISECMRLIRERHGKNYNFKNINYDEKEVLNEFCNGDITSFFQFDTPTARPWVQSLNKINNIVDLAIGTSALRPGPMNMGMHEELLQRINGEKPVTYLHKSLEPILKETYGIVIFQEQVMIIVREIGGLSEDESLIVMKAMSKKKFDKLIVYKDIFIDSAVKNHGMEKALAENIWELLAAFAEYGFNKSHAVAYAHTSYLCAWFKHHYFMEWISAVLTIGNKDDFKAFYQKWKKYVLKPDINQSKEKYNIAVIEENGKTVEKVVMPISSVNGVGAKAVEEIISKQPFRDFDDFFERINLRVCKKNVVINLILSGCFDVFNDGKTVMYKDKLLPADTSTNFFRKVLSQYFYMLSHKKSKPPKNTKERDKEKLQEIADMNKGHMLLKEISLLNFTSFDYSEYYRDKLKIVEEKKRVKVITPDQIKDLSEGARVACVGASMDLKIFYTKKKQKMGRFMLSNNGDNVDITVFPNTLEKDEQGKGTINKLIDYFPLVVIGTVNEYNGRKSVIFDEGIPLIKMT